MFDFIRQLLNENFDGTSTRTHYDIFSTASEALQYANSRGRRVKEAEKIILENPKVAYKYAKEIINGPWPEAENRIMGDPEAAYLYSRFVLKKRWEAAEKFISRNNRWWTVYKTWLNSL